MPLVLLAPAALAQSAPEFGDSVAESPAPGDIVVVATRLSGQVRAPQPPIVTLDEEDIASYGASSIGDLITALGPQTGSGRGRGEGRPAILLNGQRISSFREMRNIPPEAIRRMEVLPEEVALRFGYPANQRVINFILKDNFSSRTIDAEFNAPTRGGFGEAELEGSLLTINKANRLNLNLKSTDGSLLTEAERGVIQQPGSQPTVAGDPDPARFRSLVGDVRDLALTASWSRGLGAMGQDGSLAFNGAIERSDSRSLAGLDVVRLTAPDGSSAVRSFADPLVRDSRTVTLSGGGTLNKPLGGWNLTATVDASHTETDTTTDRRADTSALVAAAAAGTLPISGGLPVHIDRRADTANSRILSVNSLLTFSGTLLRLPAGEATTTVKAGYEHSAIRSRDTRTLAGGSTLLREDRYAGVNIALPLTSRREDVLAGIGDVTLNLSAGAADLSDFGGLTDWSAGVTWSPFEKLALQASYLVNEQAPTLANLGNPLVQSFNVPVFDFTRGETALVTISSGGNPALIKEKQRDLKLSANYELPFLRNSNVVVEYFRNRSDNVTAVFPVLTPEVKAAFPGRAVRDASGRLVSIDRRPVTFDQTNASRLRYGFNISGTLGKADPASGAGRARGGAIGGRPPGAGAGETGANGASGGGPGGGGMRGMMGGGGNGQGRWNLSVYHTLRFEQTVQVAAGGPLLDLLRGDALSGGGVARHAFELEGGGFYRGFGLRMNGSWAAPTHLRGNGTPGATDLRFGSVLSLDLRAFIDFDRQKRVVAAVPFLKGARLSFDVKNFLDSRQRVTDGGGTVPLSYQPDFLDPRGRFVGIDFRKAF